MALYWLLTGKIVSLLAVGGRGFLLCLVKQRARGTIVSVLAVGGSGLLYLVKQYSLILGFTYWSSTFFSKGRVPS